jgi:hypothetical protein
MKNKQQINAELECAFQDLLVRGLVRPTGRYRNGQVVYEATPEAEQSAEVRALCGVPWAEWSCSSQLMPT